MNKSVFSIIFLMSIFIGSAQYSRGDSNRIGIGAGLNQFSLVTDDFSTEPGNGWNIGLSLRGNFYNNFDMVYGIQFSENNFTAATTNALLIPEDVKFKLASAQISLLLSYKIVENHLSVELGPMLQVNGKMTIEDNDETNIVEGTLLTAKELTDISTFNFYPTVGLTAGFTNFRINGTYQYGLTNILGNVSSAAGGKFKGRGQILSVNLLVYL